MSSYEQTNLKSPHFSPALRNKIDVFAPGKGRGIINNNKQTDTMNTYEQIANAIYTLSAMEQSTLLDLLQQQVKSNMADEISKMAENDCDAPEKEVVVDEEEDYFLLLHADADCAHYERLGDAIKHNADTIIAPMIALAAQRRNKVVEKLAVHFGQTSVEQFKRWVHKTEGSACLAMERLNSMRGIDAFSYYLKLQKTYKMVFQDFKHYHELTIEIIQGRLDFYNFVSVLNDRLWHITNVYTTALTGNYTDDEINVMIGEIRALDYSKWEFLVETTSPFIDRLVEIGLRSRAENPLEECSVCYDETRKKTKCGHSLCYDCWRGIMRTNLGNMKCPMCRTQIY
jgi:hypothetical protein